VHEDALNLYSTEGKQLHVALEKRGERRLPVARRKRGKKEEELSLDISAGSF